MNIAIVVSLIGVLAAALPAASRAEETQAGQGPLTAPVQNINGFSNPTAPAHLPSTYTGGAMAPTFPSGPDKPAFQGGTIGDDPSLRSNARDPLHERDWKFERERSLPEPAKGAVTPTPPGDLRSRGAPSNLDPDSSDNINPGAMMGGPQP